MSSLFGVHPIRFTLAGVWAMARCLPACAVLIAFALRCGCAQAEETWLPVRDDSLLIEEGSVLDFSAWAPKRAIAPDERIAIAQGKLAVQSPRRFLMASMGFSGFDGYPDHATADVYVRQLRLHGYNMARLDFQDATLMEGRADDFDFDPEQLDRLFYLFAALRRAGIYYILNGLSSPNGGYGGIADRWMDRKKLKSGVHFHMEAQEHWKTLMRKLFAAANPYTGTTTLADPALAGIIMVNEGGLQFLLATGSAGEIRGPFNEWLRQKYQTDAALRTAWSGELRDAERLDASTVALPPIDAGHGKRMADFQRFTVETEKRTAAWMTAYLRSLGYEGLVTAYNNWLSPSASASRRDLAWIDFHHYFAEPSAGTEQGSSMSQGSIFDDDARYVRDIAAVRQLNKPFTLSEYAQVFWNRQRRESALAVPAYASLQDWDLICQHASAIEMSYSKAWAANAGQDALGPFRVGLDPIARAGETLASLLFLRGDVLPARHRIAFASAERHAFERGSMYDSIAPAMTKLALVSRIGQGEDGQGATLSIDLQNHRVSKAGRPLGVLPHGAGASGLLRGIGMLSDSNRTDAANRLYQSDTGQIVFDGKNRVMTVASARSEAIVFDRAREHAIGNLRIVAADGPALVAVASVDGAALAASERLLVIAATDSRNSGMAFSDREQTTLQTRGMLPVLLRAARIAVTLKTHKWETLNVYSTTLGGRRADRIEVQRTQGEIAFVLDTHNLSHGPTTFFEIVAGD